MIYHLLTAITITLQSELKDSVPLPEAPWNTVPITAPTQANLPLIALYPGPLQSSQRSNSQISQLASQPAQPEANEKTAPVLATTQEFQQTFSIDLYTQSPEDLEKLSSLIVGILLTYQDPLIKRYNTTEPSSTEPSTSDPPTTYQAKTVTTRHHLRQYQFLSSTPTYPPDPTAGVGLTLTFSALGHLTLSKPVTEGLHPIETIDIDITSKRPFSDSSHPEP
ncbi:MAG: hypothetical protein AB8B99_14360 [Phormidesmis sp.]